MKRNVKDTSRGASTSHGVFVNEKTILSCLEKSKKLRVKRLSAVVSEEDDRCETANYSNEFNKPHMKEFLVECSNGVHKSTVPRKLRSAMKKRNCGSVSTPLPNLKKLKHDTNGVEPVKVNGAKRSMTKVKDERADWSSKQQMCGQITKDEEEVAATLSALAGMFPENDITSKNCADLNERSSVLVEARESTPLLAAAKEDSGSNGLSRIEEPCGPSNLVKSEGGNTKTNHSDTRSAQEALNLSSSKLGTEDLVAAPQPSYQTTLLKHEGQKHLFDSARSSLTSEPFLEIRKAKELIQPASVLDRKQEIALDLSTAIKSRPDQHRAVDGPKENGLALWSGMSSTALSGDWNQGPSSQSSVVKIPAWLGRARGRVSLQTSSTIAKFSEVKVDRTKCKRCAAHVYISWFIQTSKMLERKESLELQRNHIPTNELLKQGAVRTCHLGGTRKELSGVKSASRNYFNGLRSEISNYPYQPQNTVYTSSNFTKQSYDFLALSAGCNGVDANNSFSEAGKSLGTLGTMPLPRLSSHLQQPPVPPVSMCQSHYTSSAHAEWSSKTQVQQAHQQVAPYLYGGRNSPLSSSVALTERQQQQLWAAQYGTQGTYMIMAQYPSIQNGPQHSRFGQATTQSSSSCLEVLRPMYSPIAQQHQHFIALNSTAHGLGKKQDCSMISSHEDSRSGFQGGLVGGDSKRESCEAAATKMHPTPLSW